MNGSIEIALLMFLVISFARCGARQGGMTSPSFTGHLSSVPVVGIEVRDFGILPWQKERTGDFEKEISMCLPPILDPFCGEAGCNYVRASEEPGASRQKNRLNVKLEYERSSHFRDGFVVIVTYEMRDPAGIETILKYRYSWEPVTKVYFEEGMDRDEVFTVRAAETAAKFCEELAEELKSLREVLKK